MRREKLYGHGAGRKQDSTKSYSTLVRLAVAVGIGVTTLAVDSHGRIKHDDSERQVVSLQNDQNIYYPEIGDHEPKAKGIFSTTAGNIFRWFNFTDYIFNPVAAEKIISFLETISYNGLNASIPFETGEVLDFQSFPVEPYSTNLFIVADNALNPAWAVDIINGGTYRQYRPGLNLTVIKLTDNYIDTSGSFTTKAQIGNFTFAVEACQNAFNVKDRNQRNNAVAQEIQCSSLGTALASIGQGYSFERYNHNQGGKAALLPTGKVVPLMIIDKTQYGDLVNQLGDIPMVISAK